MIDKDDLLKGIKQIERSFKENELYRRFTLELLAYINLPKFSNDVMINKADILLRINELRQELSILD